MEKFIRLSVHQLVDFLLRSGDIDNRIFNRSSMTEGSRIHNAYQSLQDSNYISEYPLKHLFVVGEVQILLEGRADGIIKRKNGEFVIDEIKTTVTELEEFRKDNIEWHLGQAKCYAYMFALEQKLESIGVKLTYIRQGKEKEQLIDNYTFFTSELEQYIYDLLEEYLEFYNVVFRLNEKRDESIKNLSFPFKNYRNGQRELAKYCYSVAKNGGRLFVEAPTGIGKTMSTLYPFIKRIAEDDKARIFYLTAKASGKESAYNAIELLKSNGLSITDIVVTARDKICFCKGKGCNPDECPYAKDYYNKIQVVLKYSLSSFTTFDEKLIQQIANENMICPFEFELDLSLFSDVIICDYNYMFDPLSYMKRFFDEDASHFLALVDEAHNLIDRSRDMYSSRLSYNKYLLARKSVRHSKLTKLKRNLTKLTKMFSETYDSLEEGNTEISNFSDNQYKVLDSFVTMFQDINKNEHKEVTKELLDFYLDVLEFMKISEFYNERYISFISKSKDEMTFNLICLDASKFLQRRMEDVKATVLFSATLSPMKYFIDTLGGDSGTDPTLSLASPFNEDNLEILVAPKVSTKYKDREKSYKEIADYIKSFVSNKIGNYFIYCPSYEYLERIYSFIELEDADIYTQTKDMSDREKIEFLDNFHSNPIRTTIGFLVIGGAFSEGIDLVSDRLIGAVIIGIGMPKINFESDKISEYFKEQNLPGYDYAYINPGMNKVMQAVGRVIRSEEDKGAVLLIDERYMSRQYKDLFREEWSSYKVVYSPKEVSDLLSKFFKN